MTQTYNLPEGAPTIAYFVLIVFGDMRSHITGADLPKILLTKWNR